MALWMWKRPSQFDSIQAVPEKQILVVDDHPDTLDVLSRLLRSLGYAVKNASTMQEAIAAASGGNVDLLISDMTLPDGNGSELAQKICANGKIPAIALSGYSAGDSPADSQTTIDDSQFKARLVKPIDFQLLQETIEKVLPE
jgi:two-component system CheB/CheR fusion protein